ncbi:MAG: hypothetical protein KA270_02860 [Saprospiraceae bacterium]|nr:hypothetical protein [Saprospiraceae bacterium]
MENNRTIAEKKSNNLFLILWGFCVIMFLSSIAIKDIYDISDSEYSLFINQYKFHILLISLVVLIAIASIFFIFDIGQIITRSIKHTEITGRSLEVFENINDEELGKYISKLQLSGNHIDKNQQTWGHTFKVTHYKNVGKFNLYVGSGWSDPIKAGDIVYFNGCEYLVLASVHTTEYSITQIYKVLMIDIK